MAIDIVINRDKKTPIEDFNRGDYAWEIGAVYLVVSGGALYNIETGKAVMNQKSHYVRLTPTRMEFKPA